MGFLKQIFVISCARSAIKFYFNTLVTVTLFYRNEAEEIKNETHYQKHHYRKY